MMSPFRSPAPVVIKSLTAAAALALFAGLPMKASALDFNFETPPTPGQYDLYDTANWSTDQARSGTHSIQLPMTTDADQPLIRFIPGGTLGTTEGSFYAYVPTGSGNLLPYMYFGVDTNQNGIWDPGTTGDSLIIAFNGGAIPNTFSHDTWVQSGLSGLTNVHIDPSSNRGNLGPMEYSSTGTQDTLNSLRVRSVNGGATTWGDLGIMRVYINGNHYGGPQAPYNSYVDDVHIAAVPEPASMVALALGGLALIRRRRSAKA